MKEIERAMKWIDEGKTDKAVAHVEQMFTKESPEKQFIIAALLEEWGFYEKAIEKYTTLHESFPEEDQIIVKLAELQIELENDDLALQLLENITVDDAYYVHSLMLAADLYERQGLHEVAEQKLMEAKKYVSKEEMYIIDFAIAELLFATGQVNRAIPFYEKVLDVDSEVNYISIVERLAESYAFLGKYEEALAYYRKIDRESPDLLFKHGFVAKQANERKEAIALWEQLIDLEPEYTSVYAELALTYEEEAMYKEAYEVAQKGISYDEFNKKLYFTAGKMAAMLQQFKDAKNLLREAIKLDEDYKEAILHLIKLFKQQDDHEEIIQLINEIKASNITDPDYEWELARAYEQIDDYANAKEAYKEASYYLTNDSIFLKEYGYFLVEEGETDEAKRIFEQYINIVPNDEEVLAFMERFFF